MKNKNEPLCPGKVLFFDVLGVEMEQLNKAYSWRATIPQWVRASDRLTQ